MVTDGLLWVVGRLLVGMLDTIDGFLPPDLDLTSWVSASEGPMSTMIAQAAALTFWVPLPFIFSMLGLLISAKVIAVFVYIVRVGLSLISGGGGAT